MRVVHRSLMALASLMFVSCAGDATGPSRVTPPATWVASGAYHLTVDRSWDGRTGSPQFPSDVLDETAYRAVSDGPVYRVTVSDGGRQLTIEGTVVGTVQAVLAKEVPGSVRYDLGRGTFAGGRFVVWSLDRGGMQAELTFYGSGVPITRSERGLFAASH